MPTDSRSKERGGLKMAVQMWFPHRPKKTITFFSPSRIAVFQSCYWESHFHLTPSRSTAVHLTLSLTHSKSPSHFCQKLKSWLDRTWNCGRWYCVCGRGMASFFFSSCLDGTFSKLEFWRGEKRVEEAISLSLAIIAYLHFSTHIEKSFIAQAVATLAFSLFFLFPKRKSKDEISVATCSV